MFKAHDLDIIAKCNMTIVNYLDVTLDLQSGTYKPYKKTDNESNYVHVQSNHPPNIIKQIPLSIQTRLSNLSFNENIFKEALPQYEEALLRSGYDHKFKYEPKRKSLPKNRKRKIIWFNPPFNMNLKTNIGKIFLDLVKKHFPRGSRLHKIFNKNNVKVSYSCMPNMKAVLSSHNKKVMHPKSTDINEIKCNCKKKDECPLKNNCLASSLVYEATLSCSDQNYQSTKYIGL